MSQNFTESFDYSAFKIPTPYYVIDRAKIRRNMQILQQVQQRTGCKILLAMKAFSSWGFFKDMVPYLSGVAASSINEVRLGKEEFGKLVQLYSPAYSKEEIKQVLPMVDYLVLNSESQYELFKSLIKKERKKRKLHCGYRINPEYSEVTTEIYNPCTSRSRFGIRSEVMHNIDSLSGIDGFHFHTMCQQGSDVLVRTLELVEERFGKYFKKLKWINFGGGHHITRLGYDVDQLCDVINDFRKRTGLDVFLEPGEAHVLYSGYLVATVLDINVNQSSIDVVVVDTSAAAHMPDVLEMPYTPELIGARKVYEILDTDSPLEEGRYKYIIGSKTCLSGDLIGEYLFRKPLKIGDRIVFADMSQYTMCKNTVFNGLQLPSIVACDSEVPGGAVEVIRTFGYEDFKSRLS
ncbi:MAG: carboxynorspermidine decarboxylase [Planctomycetaceae bacterium]|jgi:carboxynorspermidine decarboxylase|nr:carboxynorspermidine decarboxylase [Planctomycetaceae bacterium]